MSCHLATYWLLAFSSLLLRLAQVEITSEEDIAGARAHKLEGIELEGVCLSSDLGRHWGKGLVLCKASVKNTRHIRTILKQLTYIH